MESAGSCFPLIPEAVDMATITCYISTSTLEHDELYNHIDGSTTMRSINRLTYFLTQLRTYIRIR